MRSAAEDFQRSLSARRIFIFFLLVVNKSILVIGASSNVGDICLDFQNFNLLNEWSKEEKCSLINGNVPALSGVRTAKPWNILSVAAYQRGPHMSFVPAWQQDNQWRFLLSGVGNSFALADFLNSTWVYDPFINSWIRLPLRVQPARRYHTLNTWCNTSVILFGGGDNKFTPFNDTWLFDGVTETWKEQDVKLWRAGDFVRPRYGHSAVIIRQPLGNCTCQESILVYGGYGEGYCLGDLWELRCIVDSNRKEQFYWISLQDDALWPSKRFFQTAADFNKRFMYMWGGTGCDLHLLPYEGIWEYDLMSIMWKRHQQVTNRLPQTCSLVSNALSFFYSRLDSIVTFSDKCIYTLKSQNETSPFDVILIRNETYDIGRTKTCAFGGENILCFTILDDTTTVRIFDYDVNRADWQWIAMPSPRAHTAESPEAYHVVGTSFYVEKNIDKNADYVLNDDDAVGLSLWEFDLRIKSWFQTWHPFAPLWEPAATYSTMNDFLFVRYYPSKSSSTASVTKHVDIYNNTGSLWLFNTTIRRWTLCLELSNQYQLPTARVESSMVDLGNGSLLVFGGLSGNTVVNDLWRVDVCDQREYLPLRINCVRWVQLTRNNSNSNFPSPRHSHSAFMFSGSLFVFGGVHVTYPAHIVNVGSEIWKFEVDHLKWKQVKQTGFNPVGLCPLFGPWIFAKWGTKVVVLPTNPLTCLGNASNSVYSFDTNLFRWSWQAMAPSALTSALTFWNGKLVVLGLVRSAFYSPWDIFTFLSPSCQTGQVSRQWEIESCESCSKGSYAALGDQKCSLCPMGLTTSSMGSSSLRDCVCRDDYCEHGECIVTSQAKASCQCKEGYTGSACRYPTYYLIGVVAVGVLLLVSFLVLFTRRMIQYRRAKKNVEKELTSAHKVWNIHCNEIDLKERIDGETPGSYGEVYRGIYRDMTVAVKHLNEMMFTDQTIKREFEREVEIMRGVRHPNIVMFFGAGEVEREERGTKVSYPFLVIEFMERGTMKKILDSSEVSLTYQNKVGFALDAAKGMQYLHALSPPRIHRDMKSANLLVSQSWMVKVSDFGSARVVKREGERQPTISRTRHEGVNARTPLLAEDMLMTSDTGTILWRPPEIFALQHYGTSADVYSYGIVLWEILCREHPYDDHNFEWIEDVSCAVQRGIRPTIPPSAPAVYVQLMKDCWHADPDRRPSFTDIVDRLVAMSDATSVPIQPEYEGEYASREYDSDVAAVESTTM